MLGSKKKEEAFPVNEALLNVITPMGLEIKRNSLVIGENLGKVYGAVRYPQKVDMGWLSKITNIPSTIVSVGITPIDNGSLISAISKSIVQQRGAADSAKDPLTRQRAEKAAEDGERIMQRICSATRFLRNRDRIVEKNPPILRSISEARSLASTAPQQGERPTQEGGLF